MKRCPQCGQTYTDSAINFCLNDGELLRYLADGASIPPLHDDSPPTIFADDSPTVVLDKPRVTNQSAWPSSSGPPVPWQGNQQDLSYGTPNLSRSRDQSLPTVSLILGVAACVFVCCYGGLWLGLPATIVGYLGMRNAYSDPNRYSGRGLAIGGMVLGIITFLASLVFLFIGLLAG